MVDSEVRVNNMHDRVIKEDTIHYCVYRLLDDKDNILYIGKSIQMKQRVANHLRGKSNISEECCKKIKRVEFLEFETEADMDLFEIYAISYFQPPYNIECTSKVGLIEIDMPKTWNELLLDNFYKVIKTEIVKGKKQKLEYDNSEIDMKGLCFDKNIFTNEDLTLFLESHFDQQLSDDDIDYLINICNIDSFNLDEINNFICYNNSKAEIIQDGDKYILQKNKKGKFRYGTLSNKTIKNSKYLCFRFWIDNKDKSFYGVDRKELADKIIKYFIKNQTTIILDNEEDNINKYAGGINKVLYNKKNKEPPKLMTKQDVMNHLQIKDDRTFYNLINKYKMPNIKIGKKIFIPEEKYYDWIMNMTE